MINIPYPGENKVRCSNFEDQYLDLMETVLVTGQDRSNRTGVDTRSLHGGLLRINMQQGFPLLTSKKMPFKTILSELAWFLSGDTDCATLDELNPGGFNIWKANAKAWQNGQNGNKHMPETYCGYLYGQLWRKFGEVHNDGLPMICGTNDQIENIVRLICNDPSSRRILLSSWDAVAHNPGSGDNLSCLPPCHILYQVDIDEENVAMNASVYMRSADLFLGVPFNISSYALLTEIISYIVFCKNGKRYKPGMLCLYMHDCHIYHNHFEACKTQLSRKNELHKLPKVQVYSKPVMTVESLSQPKFIMDSCHLYDYKHHAYIKADMAV